jgi:hypothetical protein
MLSVLAPVTILSLFTATPQSSELPADPLQAPLTCAIALSVVDQAKPVLIKSAAVSHLLAKRVAATASSTPFLERLTAIDASSLPYPKDVTPEQARALAPKCDQRYPQARRDGPVKLPADPLARDLVCLFSLSTQGGAAGESPELAADAKRYNDEAARFAKSVDARLAASGMSDDQQSALANRQIIAGLDLGNAHIVSQACLALPGA